MKNLQLNIDSMFNFVGDSFLYELLNNAHGLSLDYQHIEDGSFNKEQLEEILESIFYDTEIFNCCGHTGSTIIQENIEYLCNIIVQNLDRLSKCNNYEQFFQDHMLPITNNVIISLKQIING